MNGARRWPRRLTPRTLRGRLSLVAVLTAALLMTVLTVVFNAVMDRHLRHQADDELRTRAAAVATTVDTSGPRVRVVETSDDSLLDTNVWIYAGTHLVERPPSTPADGTLTRAAATLAAHADARCTTVGMARMCSRPGPATVVTALDLSPYRNSARTLLLGSLALDAVMLGCTYALTRLAVGRALRPVRTMTDQATEWSAVGSDERFGDAGQPAELARLGASLDALLDRIRTVLRHERQLTGELSHELRTPLTRIVVELDWWHARPRTAAETLATHGVIADAAQSMVSICEALLDDARDAAVAPGVTEVGAVLRKLADGVGGRGVTVTVEPSLTVGVAPVLVERIISPLLANALRYARSTVTLSARRVPGGVRVEVADDGPGVPQAFVDDLFQPGRRADPGDGHDGAGLGLPLARRLARAAGGEVSYDSGYAAGARFAAELPSG